MAPGPAGLPVLTADGTKIVTATWFTPRQRSHSGYAEITEYSVRTGKPVLSQDRFSSSVGYQQVLWASPDGSALVVSDPRGKRDSYGDRANVLGILTGNKFTPVPHGADTFQQIAWSPSSGVSAEGLSERASGGWLNACRSMPARPASRYRFASHLIT